MQSALKIFNLVRNRCAHEERLYNSDFGNVRVANMANHFRMTNYNNRRIVVAIIYLKIMLNKNYFKKFYSELMDILRRYQGEFVTVSFDSILDIMGIDLLDIQKLN